MNLPCKGGKPRPFESPTMEHQAYCTSAAVEKRFCESTPNWKAAEENRNHCLNHVKNFSFLIIKIIFVKLSILQNNLKVKINWLNCLVNNVQNQSENWINTKSVHDYYYNKVYTIYSGNIYSGKLGYMYSHWIIWLL